MAKTKEERLAEIDEAITAIIKGGQSYRIGTRSLTRADLGMLRAMRKEILSSDSSGDLLENTFVAIFDRR